MFIFFSLLYPSHNIIIFIHLWQKIYDFCTKKNKKRTKTFVFRFAVHMNSSLFHISHNAKLSSQRKNNICKICEIRFTYMPKFSQQNYIKSLFLALNESDMHLVSNMSDLRLQRIRKIKILASFYT